MVNAAIGSLVLLLWPVGRSARDAGSGRLLRSGVLQHGRWWPAAAGLSARIAIGGATGPGPGLSAGALTATVVLLVQRSARTRTQERDYRELVSAVGTVLREVQAGAEPPAAIRAACVAHPGARAGPLAELEVRATSGRLDPAAGTACHPSGGDPPRGPDDPVRRPSSRGRQPHTWPGAVGRKAQRNSAAESVGRRLLDGWWLASAGGVPWTAVLGAQLEDLRAEADLRQARRAETAGPRMSGLVLAALPALGLLLGAGMGAHPVQVLVHGSTGAGLLMAGTGLICTGLLWIDRILRG